MFNDNMKLYKHQLKAKHGLMTILIVSGVFFPQELESMPGSHAFQNGVYDQKVINHDMYCLSLQFRFLKIPILICVLTINIHILHFHLPFK